MTDRVVQLSLPIAISCPRARRVVVALISMVTLLGCPPDRTPTYANVEAEVRRSCAPSGDCHGGVEDGQANLNFEAAFASGRPITELLVGVPACEYDFLPRIAPGDPDGSWLMIKLDSAHDEEGLLLFDPDPSWDSGLVPRIDGSLPPSTCPLTDEGELTFGRLMPHNPLEPAPLSPDAIRMIREWIELGAPGPED